MKTTDDPRSPIIGSMNEERTLPVVEIFGPTVQGEGALAGLPTMFVRLGYCDYRCSWCDSMFAVEPDQVKAHGERLSVEEISERLRAPIHLWPAGKMWVTISGGNPAIHDLDDLRAELQQYLRVAVETQGSVWRPWLAAVDHLTVSPKPPSSGMATLKHREQTSWFLARSSRLIEPERRSLKIVVFDADDLVWARDLFAARREMGETWDTYLSAGTDPVGVWGSDVVAARGHRPTVAGVADRYGWLCEMVAADPAFALTRVLPQLHVIAWGHRRAV